MEEWLLVTTITRLFVNQDLITILGNQEGEIKIVTDGSVKDQIGTAAGVIILPTKQIHIDTLVPGRVSSSFRAELFGIVSCLYVVKIMEEVHNIVKSYRIGIDNIESAKSIFDREQGSYEDSIDIITVGRNIIKNIQSSVTWQWVQAHQKERGENLDEWAYWNDRMDSRAKELIVEWQDRFTEDTNLDQQRVSVWKGKVRIQHAKLGYLYRTTFGTQAKEYWGRKFSISKELVADINWPALGQALKNSPVGLRRWHTKFSSGHIGTASKMLLRKHRDNDLCPRCGSMEDNKHVVRCASGQMIWKKSVASVDSTLRDLQTDPLIHNGIITILDKWIRTVPHRPDTPMYRAQVEVGIFPFICGFMHISWQEAQHRFYSRIGSKRSAKKWSQAIIKKLFMIAWDQWEFRNSIQHSEQSTDNQQKNKEVTRQIQQELRKGIALLCSQDIPLFLQGEKILQSSSLNQAGVA